MYFVTSSPSFSIDLRFGNKEAKGNLRFSPPVGFDMIATVIVFVDVVVFEKWDFEMLVLGFVEDVLDGAVAEVA